jgi:hypothetical protein
MPARGFTRVHDTDQSTQVVQQRAWQNREEYRPSGREEYRDAARSGPPLRRWGGRPAGSGNLCKEKPRARCSRRSTTAPRRMPERRVAPRFRGQGRPRRPARAFSSVGESARLITVRSLVRIQKGPRSSGDVAQLGEHLLCKQGVAGSSPAISTSERPFRCLFRVSGRTSTSHLHTTNSESA